MIEGTALTIGLAAGVLFGAVIAGFITSSRVRARMQAQLLASAERAQRAETLTEEFRRRGDEDRAVLDQLRQELANASHARAVAETQAVETLRQADEQKNLLSQARHELIEAFQALSGEALKHNNEAFLNLAKTSFQTLQAEAKGDLARRQQAIDELVKPLTESLHRYDEQLRHIEQSRQAAYGGLDQHLKLLAESQQRLQEETGNLVHALRSPTVRGRWGEITLRRVAELAGMVAHCDFVEQGSVTAEEGRIRPDMIVNLPGGRQIIVDSKTVLAGYLDAHEAENEERRLEGLQRHAAQVRSRMDQLSLKAYWSQFEQTPEFVVLFLPGEQFLGAALEQDSSLIEDGFAQGVVLATPTTLMALLRAVAYGWRQERLTAHAEEAGRLGRELYERMAVLAEHLNDVGQSLGKSVVAYNKAVGSLETRILPAARKFKELGVSSEKETPSLSPIETVPRKALPHEYE
ncbi:putative DNA recombination protein RmuC [Nitrospira sp. KM1]|uniref:DNA recombination protein RmuC n=1 Tax=Nitrospira sp. KM1 TaxID=1936990 RepID=UPI0013A7B1FC|nr:DNA recombination protein RmuC [Nitrospira sp. KM1]BCA55641.1 putative DNA recombination protein RmuC [Nitrospira sp. KM1]